MFRAREIPVDDSPKVALTGARDASAGARLVARNDGPDVVYVGGENLDPADPDTRFSIPMGGAVPADVEQDEVLYAQCASGDTATVSVLQGGVA